VSGPTRPPPSRHGPVAQLLIALSPLSLILLSYVLGDWIDGTIDVGGEGSQVNRLGFGLSQAGVAAAEQRVLGVVPSVWLQEHLAGGGAHWWDAVASLVYVTHFVSIPLLTLLVWFRLHDRYRAWLAAVLTFTAVGVAGYVVYPASPPWLAAQDGLIGPVDRISGLGWHYLHLVDVGEFFGSSQSRSNQIAAMPSLHAGSAMLVALFLWPVAPRLWRAVLAGYVLLMALTLVYTGEHYVLDVLGGWVTALLAAAAGALSGGRRRLAVEDPDPAAAEHERAAAPASGRGT